MWLATGEQMQKIDSTAIETYGIPGLVLMEAASCFAAGVATEMLAPGGRVVVGTGSGHNGACGWGMATHLAAKGIPVRVVSTIDPLELSGDAKAQYRLYHSSGLAWEQYTSPGQLTDCELLVDALLGTGIQGKPRGITQEIIQGINSAAGDVLAIDIPSGLPSDCSGPGGEVVQAAGTVSFGLAKAGLYTPAGRQAAGRIFIDPIGLPEQLLRGTGLILNDAANAAQHLPRRSLDSHKGSYGHGLLVAGSRGMSGAALLAGSAALRSGIGLLTAACPDVINQVIETNLWEALSLPLPSTEGSFGPDAVNGFELDKYSAAAVGPGCRVCDGTRAMVNLLVESNLSLVIDADGLNSLVKGVPRRKAGTIVSPHPREMTRLLGNNIGEVLANPLETARRAAREWGCIVILKGATSYIAAPDGLTALNITGTDGLATGGSGDVLTGLLLGLLAQGVAPFAAACTGTWLLGRASELAAQELGTAPQLPRDVLQCLPSALSSVSSVST
jgi:NAD(P)H-hydrate epimerase